ncbi:MAG TPA: D-alanine--D-alanine ligase [Firmicutes bacterium]|nr:D-alanine--D-alanine ligase [Candidatus Fermentithermobacillaceae bacterium]
MSETRLCLFFGGRSGEHEVSVRSAKAVYQAAVANGYRTMGVGIAREGCWVYLGDCRAFFNSGFAEVTDGMGPACHILPDPTQKGLFVQGMGVERPKIDVVFPVLHGSYGEDGTVQGLLELAGIPYVGAPVLASAICMDKDTTKRVLTTYGVPHVPAVAVERFQWQSRPEEVLEHLSRLIRLPVFVKPSASGSSLGVTKVKTMEALPEALDLAFLYDTKALLEPSQEGFLEIECSVLGNDEPVASIPGQILPKREFYDYRAKYIDDDTELRIPAPLEPVLAKKVQDIAIRAFQATGCKGMARVDFFVNPAKGDVLVNELNTIPGFTSISMYPKLWEASGLSFPELVKTLVELAVERQASSWREVRLRA